MKRIPHRGSILAALVLVAALASCTRQVDVLVVGGGTSGTAAALQSARLGVSTLVVESGPWLGGMLTSAGVSAIDGNYRLRGGIFGEFCDSLAARYGGYEALQSGWVSNILFEPHVGNEILGRMTAAEPHLEVMRNTTWVDVRRRDEAWIVTVEDATHRRRKIRTKVLIDATELGDVAAHCGVPYRIGMDARSLTGETIAPEQANDIIQDLTYVAVLKDYGPEADRTLPRPEGYSPDYYRNCAQNRLNTTPAPGQKIWPVETMITYGRLPGGQKYMINWPIDGNDYYAQTIDASPEERTEALKRARNFTLGFVYFLQTELGLRNLGIADDEFPTDDGLPMIPYYRESRRIVGEVLFTVDDAARPYDRTDKLYRTGIAVGDYAVDHHHHRYPDWKRLPELHFYPIPSYSLPLGTILPHGFDNLLVVEKSISVSNLVNGTTRLQPVVMQIGQAAGVVAARAVTTARKCSEVGVREVQRTLLDAGGYVMPYLDLAPASPWFGSVQRIGATGLLHGEGRNVGWSNETWFRTQDPLLGQELGQEWSEYFPGIDPQTALKQGPVTVAEAVAVIAAVKNDPAWNAARIEMWWNETMPTAFDPQRNITRLEFAILLDRIVDPFSREVDYKGFLKS